MWTVIGPILGALGTLIAGLAAYQGIRQKRLADGGTQQIESVKLSLASLEAALKRSDLANESLRQELATERAAHDQTRADMRALRRELESLRTEVRAERRQHADRVKVLIRQVRALGGEVIEDGDGHD